jgi:hypothetical protein
MKLIKMYSLKKKIRPLNMLLPYWPNHNLIKLYHTAAILPFNIKLYIVKGVTKNGLYI